MAKINPGSTDIIALVYGWGGLNIVLRWEQKEEFYLFLPEEKMGEMVGAGVE